MGKRSVGIRYKKIKNGGRCLYCGEAATELDHQPPLSRIHDFSWREFLKVECCAECNRLLYDYPSVDIEERIREAKNRLKKKYCRELNTPEWEDWEIEEGGQVLAAVAKASNALKVHIWLRLEYTQGVLRLR